MKEKRPLSVRIANLFARWWWIAAAYVDLYEETKGDSHV